MALISASYNVRFVFFEYKLSFVKNLGWFFLTTASSNDYAFLICALTRYKIVKKIIFFP